MKDSSNESSTSVLRTKDWQKIQVLLKEVIIDTYCYDSHRYDPNYETSITAKNEPYG